MQKFFLSVAKCTEDYILAEDVYTSEGTLIVPKESRVNEYIKKRLEDFGIDFIQCDVKETSNVGNTQLDEEHRMKLLESIYDNSVNEYKQIVLSITKGDKINESSLNSIIHRITESRSFPPHMITRCLHRTKQADTYTYTHSVSVAFYCMLTAIWLKLSDDEVIYAAKAGLLHDIGKSKIPIDILEKPDKLSGEEFDLMKKHSEFGFDCLENMHELNEDIRRAVLMHHEREDGSGYPTGVYSDQINLYGKIIAIADIYDSMTTNRVYKNKKTPFEAFQELEIVCKNKLDREILCTFIKRLSMYYIGSTVKLDSGEHGIVVFVSPHNVGEPVIKTGDSYIDFSSTCSVRILEVI